MILNFSPYLKAPEVIQEVGYGVSADIWSLGITCIEMADGRPPYHNIHPMRAIFMIPTKPPPTLEDEDRYSVAFRNFVARCLTKDPAFRPTAEELLKVCLIFFVCFFCLVSSFLFLLLFLYYTCRITAKRAAHVLHFNISFFAEP